MFIILKFIREIIKKMSHFFYCTMNLDYKHKILKSDKAQMYTKADET